MSIPDDLRAVLRERQGEDWRARGRRPSQPIGNLSDYQGPDLTPRQLAECLNPPANVRTVHRWIREGRLKAELKNDHEWRILTGDAVEFVAMRYLQARRASRVA